MQDVKLSQAQPQEELLKLTEISLLLDTYDDIFSDFDPRGFHERALSVDFLDEIKRASREQKNHLEIKLMIPKKMRNVIDEVLIKKRLHEHFQKHAKQLELEVTKERNSGIYKTLAGMAMIVGAGILMTLEDALVFNILIALVEPAGWFTAWTGLEDIFYNYKTLKPDHDFYQKMSMARITFCSY